VKQGSARTGPSRVRLEAGLTFQSIGCEIWKLTGVEP
jgi:hypothetical protein